MACLGARKPMTSILMVHAANVSEALQEFQGSIDRDEPEGWAVAAGTLEDRLGSKPILGLGQDTRDGLARGSQPVPLSPELLGEIRETRIVHK